MADEAQDMMATTRINDLLEDREGDKAVVTAVDIAQGTVTVRWDCTGREGLPLPITMFTNLSARVRELSDRG